MLSCLQYRSKQKELGAIKVALIYLVYLIVEIVILCARADFMLNEGDDYKASILKNGDLVYIKSGLENLGDESREKVECPYDLEDVRPAPDSTCSYWFIDLNPNLVSQGWVQFSIGVGLIVAILLRFIAFGCKLAYDFRENDDPGSYSAAILEGCCGWFFMTVIEMTLHFQQFISLLPIEVILPNAYCLDVQVPVATMKAICRYKIAAAAIPIGVPISIGGFGFAAFMGALIDSTEGWCKFIVAMLAIYGVILGMYGLSFVVFWLFGGIVLGYWYVFGGVSLNYLTSNTNLILVALSSSVFILLLIEKVVTSCFPSRNYRAAREVPGIVLELPTGFAAT